jgi:glutaredoxin
MKVTIFGRKDCQACRQARQKMEYYLAKWQIDIPLEYCDMETPDGLALGAFHDVAEIPTVLLEEDGKELGRWVKFPPRSEELKELIRVF